MLLVFKTWLKNWFLKKGWFRFKYRSLIIHWFFKSNCSKFQSMTFRGLKIHEFFSYFQVIQLVYNLPTICWCQYGHMPGNVLNAKRVHFVAPVKMMISCYFAMTAIVVITCIVWYPPLKSHQKDLGVVKCALQLFIRNNAYKIIIFFVKSILEFLVLHFCLQLSTLILS